jgi:hypothetical protein
VWLNFVWFICYHVVYETMLYVLYVPYGSLCVVHLCFYELMVIGEMAMELLFGFSSLSYTEFHFD